MPLQTTQEIFSEAKERLNRVYQELGDIQDLLHSEPSDRQSLTEEQDSLGSLMFQQISVAKQAVENAKSGQVR